MATRRRNKVSRRFEGSKHGAVMPGSGVRRIRYRPVFVYYPRNEAGVTVGYGIGARVGGAGRSRSMRISAPGGALDKEELYRDGGKR